MSLKFASLGSGSAGNATVVAYETAACTRAILIDCGFSAKETVRRLERLELHPQCLDAILVTHEHGDHAKGVAAMARRFDLPVYMSRGTSIAGEFEGLSTLNYIRAELSFKVGEFDILPVTVAHDAREPIQFVVSIGAKRVGILTDLGSITPNVIEAYSSCAALLVEANHDIEMLSRGPYPISLQRRVGGAWGHLNNDQCLDLLTQLDCSALKCLVVGHISEKNNDLERVKVSLAPVTCKVPKVVYACQSDGFSWLQA